MFYFLFFLFAYRHFMQPFHDNFLNAVFSLDNNLNLFTFNFPAKKFCFNFQKQLILWFAETKISLVFKNIFRINFLTLIKIRYAVTTKPGSAAALNSFIPKSKI